jgi:hypothetical protein
VTNTVYTFRDDEWKEILPPMPTPRWFPTTVSYNDELILVAGGTTQIARDGSFQVIRTVEVYIKNRQWYTTKQTPIPLRIFSTCVISGTCYMLGASREILSISLPTLIEAATGEGPPGEWKMLKEHPLFFSTLVELNGKLVAVGGSHDDELRRGTRFISYYDFAADMWVECTGAQLSTGLGW